MRRNRRLIPFVTLLLITMSATFAVVRADGPVATPGVTTLTGLRSWSAPSNTRIVLAFSATVTPVAPDSGRSRELVIAFPGEVLPRAAGVPSMLAVKDGLIEDRKSVV